jgi:hypothetical protein
MATLALLFGFVSPKILEEKTKNKSTSLCPKVTGTHCASVKVLKFEVLSVGFQDLDRQTDKVFFFFFPALFRQVAQG